MRPYIVEHHVTTYVPVTSEDSGDVAYVLDDTKTKTRIVGFDRLRDVLDYANEHDMVYVSDPFSPFSMNNWLDSAPDEAYTDGERLHWVQHSMHAKDGFTEREWVAVLLAMRKQWPYCY